MIEFYKTYDNVTKKISTPEIGCWINVVSPNEEEKKFLIGQQNRLVLSSLSFHLKMSRK